jgi:hypothetical protein
MVGNGKGIFAAPAGTANVALATTPPAAWVDLGYASDSGVTLSIADRGKRWGVAIRGSGANAHEEQSRTFAFELMQWNADVLTFVLAAGLSRRRRPRATFADQIGPRRVCVHHALDRSKRRDQQFYVARGKVTGDVGAQLTRTAAGVFTVTFTSTPAAPRTHGATRRPRWVRPCSWRRSAPSRTLRAATLRPRRPRAPQRDGPAAV